MATITLNATADTLSLTQNSVSSMWSNIYDGSGGVDTISFPSDAYPGTSHFTLSASADGVVTMTSTSGAKKTVQFINFEQITFRGGTTIKLGTSAADSITGGSSADAFLFGLGGDDTIDGGAGADKMMGGAGNDTYIVDNASDNVVEALNDGTDTIKSSVAISALAANVENLTLTGTSAINGTGNSLDNVITGNSANNTLTGGGGTDTVVYAGNKANFTVTATDATHATITGTGFGTDTLSGITSIQFNDGTFTIASFMSGGGGSNTITGTANNDTLTGDGTKTLVGLGGDDTYVISAAGDTITEAANGGTDTVQSSITYSIAALANVENITLTGSALINATGNGGNNVLTGNSANNMLTGGAGNDTLTGGGGSDTAVYSGAQANYTVTTSDGISGTITGPDGTDTLNNITNLQFSDATVTLMSFKPVSGGGGPTSGNDALNGTAGNDIIDGLGGDDTINGLAGDDTLTGGAGNDTIIGGGGSDTAVYSGTKASYTVTTSDGISGTVTGPDGSDTLTNITTLKFSDATVTLMSFKPVSGGGATSGNDVLNGTAGNDIIDGLAGDDTINGLAGDDTLTGGAGNDTITGGGGIDIAVYSGAKANYTVTTSDGISGTVTGPDGTDTLSNITTLRFSDGDVTLMSFKPASGGGPINGTAGAESLTGTAANDIIYGFGGNDILDGKGGNDTMDGGAGDDIFYVDSVNDNVREFINNGHDTICSSVSIAGLRVYVEDLKLIGSAAKGVGNADANVITGNGAANQLLGMAGNDTLKGGLGADRLTGGAGKDALTGGGGKDIFDFNALAESKVGATRDVITDFVHGSDRIDLSTLDANGAAAGNTAFLLQYGKGLPFTGLKGLVHFAWKGANTIVEGDVNGDHKADFQIELAGHIALTKADFIL